MEQLKLRPREIKWLAQVSIAQRSLIILAPGTGFVEITFPWTRVGGMVSGWVKDITFIVHFIDFVAISGYSALTLGLGLCSCENLMVWLIWQKAELRQIWVMGNGCKHRWRFACSPTAYLPWCILRTGPWPWGLRTSDTADQWWYWHLITIVFSCSVMSDSLQPHGL